ncbi:MAG: UDP binding domain-containing protein, partial [Steroidobacteraceae bacterium]
MNAVIEVNELQKRRVLNKLERHLGKLRGKSIALLGLAFKPNTDDMREAPARAIIDLLLKGGARVRAYDPVALEEARRIYGARDGEVTLCRTAYDAAEGADALAIATEWQEFRSPDFDRLRQLLKEPLIFDGRNLYDPAVLGRFGFTYYGVGRGKSLGGSAGS